MIAKTALLAAAALLALSACGKYEPEAEKGTKVSIAIDGDAADAADAHAADAADADTAVNIVGDSATGKLEIKLPGGLEAKVDMPGGMADKAKFDIDGVGLYPGAKVGTIEVKAYQRKAGESKGTKNAVVNIGFSAPADAAAVADWYQQQFEAKKIVARRRGETLSGKTADGDDFTLALSPAAAGGATGMLTIIDAS